MTTTKFIWAIVFATLIGLLITRTQAQHDHGTEHDHGDADTHDHGTTGTQGNPGNAANKGNYTGTGNVAAWLSPPLRDLLKEEMRLLDLGMGALATAISAGEWKTVEMTAFKIQRSYVLKQQLTPQAMTELHNTLPPEFLAMDHQFHDTAGKLAEMAAKPSMRNGELAAAYYTQLLEGCVSCHATFALERFPGLADPHAGHDH